jgi:uncharacterized protein
MTVRFRALAATLLVAATVTACSGERTGVGGAAVPAAEQVPTTATTPAAVAATATNPLMADISLPRAGCALPQWSRFEEGVREWFATALECLDRSWEPVLRKLKLPWATPKFEISVEVTSSDCDVPHENSFHCAGSIHIVPTSYLSTRTGPDGQPAAAFAMLAHEYAHHVQWLSGTSTAAQRERKDAGRDTPAGLEVSRRLELQAQCLSGMYLAATVDPTTLALAAEDNRNRGDYAGRDRDHGTPENSGAWFVRGAERNLLSACNTWTAAPGAVA